MSQLANALRAATAVALMGSFAWLAGSTATADPNPTPDPSADPGTGNPADLNTLSANLSKGYGLNNCTAQTDYRWPTGLSSVRKKPRSQRAGAGQILPVRQERRYGYLVQKQHKDDVLVNCGDSSTKGPAPWHQGPSATTNGGQMVCGTYAGWRRDHLDHRRQEHLELHPRVQQ